jgi:adenylylsulfate kinase
MTQKGFTLWFTGLSGSGKTTLADLVYEELKVKRGLKVEKLDGDVIRTNLSKGLGFSKEDRDTNIRRIGFVCHILTRNDVIAIASAISPYRAIRDENRALVGSERFIETYVEVPIEVAIERDVKGLYKKALSGEIPQFTGISDPYEAPLNPEITVNSGTQTVEESLAAIITYLEGRGFIEPTDESGYSGEEEEAISAHLEALGYL